jgi:hypothetical protein
MRAKETSSIGGFSYPIGGTQNSGGSGGIITVLTVTNGVTPEHLSGTSGGSGYGGFGLNYCDKYTEHLYEKDTELIGVMTNGIRYYDQYLRDTTVYPYGGGGGGGGGFYGGGGGAGTGGAGGSSYCDPFLCSNIEYSSSTIPSDGHIAITYAVEAANNALPVTLPPTSVTVPPSTLPGGVIMTNTESTSVSFSVRVAFFAVLILLLLFIAYRACQNNNSSMSDTSQSVINSTISHNKPIYNPLNPHDDYEKISTSN